jgi:peptidoglycan/LPS O-acetylase OafA/YrhL
MATLPAPRNDWQNALKHPADYGSFAAMEGSGTRRVASLDIGRFAACWYVMFFHAGIDTHVQNVVLGYGFSGVQFFMMLSGYVLARPYLEVPPLRPFELRRYAIGRVARILPPYYVVVLIAAALSFFRVGSSATPVPRADLGWHVLAHLSLTHTFFATTHRSLVSVLWSLGLEWQYYLTLPLLLLAVRAWKPLPALLVVAVVTLATRWLLPGIAPPGADLLNGVFLARWTEFAAGVCLAALLGQGWTRGRLVALAVAWCVGGFAWAAFSHDREMAVQGVVFVTFVLLRFFGPATASGPVTRALQFLGEVSYSTYLVHTLAGKTLLTLLGHLPGAAALGAGPRIFLYALAGQAAGIAFYYVVERPTTRWAAAALAPLQRLSIGVNSVG